jgi:hypothetical protein
MAVVEICGNNMKPVFKDLDISYKKTYTKKSERKYSYDLYEVYEISQNDLKKLAESIELPNNSWWDYSKGSNMGTAYELFNINGRELIGWAGTKREYLHDCWCDFDFETKAKYNHSFKEYENTALTREYDTLLDYIHEELGEHMYHKVCALAVDLARANGLTMSQLFEVYEG